MNFLLNLKFSSKIFLFFEFFKNISNLPIKLSISLDIKFVPLILSLIISYGPGLASVEKTGILQNPASIKTNPGSSQSEGNIKPLAFFKYGKIFPFGRNVCLKIFFLVCFY